MRRFFQLLGVLGSLALVSVPWTMFLAGWTFTWVAFGKLAFGSLAIFAWALRRSFRLGQLPGRAVLFTSLHGMVAFSGLALLVFANILAALYPVEIDLTPEQQFSLAPQTRASLAELSFDLELLAFYPPKDPALAGAGRLLDQLKAASNRLHVQVIDPSVRPDWVERYGIRAAGPRLVLRWGDQHRLVSLEDPLRTSPEEAFTRTLREILHPSPRVPVCRIGDAGDSERTSGFDTFLEDARGEGFSVETISLREGGLNERCRVVLVLGSNMPLTPEQVSALGGYLANGGRLFVALSAGEDESLLPLVREYGIEPERDVVVQPSQSTPLDVPVTALGSGREHPVLRSFFQDKPLPGELQGVFTKTRSLHLSSDSRLGTKALVSTDNKAWAHPGGLSQLERLQPEEGRDRLGPLTVVALAQPIQPTNRVSRLLIWGSSQAIRNGPYASFPFHRNLALNGLAWLADEDRHISLRPRWRSASTLRMSDSQVLQVTFWLCDLLPLVIAGLGVLIWRYRKSS